MELEADLDPIEVETALHRACLSVSPTEVNALFSEGADVTKTDSKGRTPMAAFLNSICLFGHLTDEHVQIMVSLANHGADIDTLDTNGWTALHLACHLHNPAAVRELLCFEPNVHVVDRYGRGSLQHLLEGAQGPTEWSRSHTEITGLLVERGESINITDSLGRTALHLACHSGNAEAVNSLKSLKSSTRLKDNKGNGCLQHSLLGIVDKKGWGDNTKIVGRLLAELRDDITSQDSDGRTALHWACRFGTSDDVKVMLSLGSDVEIKDNNGQTCLSWLLESISKCQYDWTNDNKDTVRLLLERGADSKATHSHEEAALYKACGGPDPDDGKENKFVDINGKIQSIIEHETALERACHSVRVGEVYTLLCQGSEVNKKNSEGQTPIGSFLNRLCSLVLWTCEHTELVYILVKHGADINTADTNGWTALHWACYFHDANAVKKLLNLDANIGFVDRSGRGVMQLLLEGPQASTEWCKSHTDITEVLVALGVSADARDDRGRTALHLACYSGKDDSIRALVSLKAGVRLVDNVDHGCMWYLLQGIIDRKEWDKDTNVAVKLQAGDKDDVNSKDSTGLTTLHWACQCGQPRAARILLALGADITTCMFWFTTTPYFVNKDIQSECRQIIQLRVEFSADIDAMDGEGRTPLHTACALANVGDVKTLLLLGADVNINDMNGLTCLGYLLNSLPDSFGGLWPKDVTAITKLLVYCGVDINTTDRQGRTALHLACYGGYAEDVRELMSLGAEANARDSFGQTCFWLLFQSPFFSHRECNWDIRAMSQILLNHEGDVNETDNDDRTVLHWACHWGTTEDIQILLSLGADVSIADRERQTCVKYLLNTTYGVRSDIADALELMVELGADINTADDEGRAAIHLTCEYGTSQAVVKLVSLGARLDIRDHEGHTCLWNLLSSILEAMNNFDNEYTAILEGIPSPHRFPKVNSADGEHTNIKPVLLGAPKQLKVNTFKTLLTLGADPNIRNTEGQTCLGYLFNSMADTQNESQSYLLEIAQLLVDNGADSNAVDGNGKTELHLACAKVNPAVVRSMLSLGADPDVLDNEGRLCLQCLTDTIENGEDEWSSSHMDILKLLLEHETYIENIEFSGYLDNDNKSDTSNWKLRNILRAACYSCDFNAIKMVLDHGVDVNIKDEEGNTCICSLFASIKKMGELPRNFTDIMKELVEHGFDMNTTEGQKGLSPLWLACRYGTPKDIKPLLSLGADVSIMLDKDKNISATCLSLCVMNEFEGWVESFSPNTTETIKILIEHGADINSLIAIKDDEGLNITTLLHMACAKVKPTRVGTLLSIGADVNMPDLKGQTCLQALLPVVKGGYPKENQWSDEHMEITKLLVEHGADINAMGQGNSDDEEDNGDDDDYEENGAEDSEAVDSEAVDSEAEDSEAEHSEAILLVQYGSDINVMGLGISDDEDDNGDDEDYEDIGAEDSEAVDSEAVDSEAGADASESVDSEADDSEAVDSESDDSEAEDSEAVDSEAEDSEAGHSETEAFCATNLRTPLWCACSSYNTEAVQSLLSLGADANVTDKKRRTCMSLLLDSIYTADVKVYQDAENIMMLLVRHGADIITRNEMGLTPLHLACHVGASDDVRTLINRGADINSKEEFGFVPLFYLLLCHKTESFLHTGHSETIQILAENGQDINAIEPDNGRTYLHEACELCCSECIARLLRLGASILQTDNDGKMPFEHLFSTDEGHSSDIPLFVIIYVVLVCPMLPFRHPFFQHVDDILPGDKWCQIKSIIQLHLQQPPTLESFCAERVRHAVGINIFNQTTCREELKATFTSSFIDIIYMRGALEEIYPITGSKIVTAKQRELSDTINQINRDPDRASVNNMNVLSTNQGGPEENRIGQTSMKDRTELFDACSSCDPEAVKRVLNYGVDANIKDEDGKSCLSLLLDSVHFDEWEGNITDVIEVLVEHGFDINTPDGVVNLTPLCIACLHGKPDDVRALLSLGADVNLRLLCGRMSCLSALVLEVIGKLDWSQERIEIITLLIEHGADINSSHSEVTGALAELKGNTLLHSVCVSGKLVLARTLLSCGADVNIHDLEGRTCLQNLLCTFKECEHKWSCEYMSIINLLVEYGADVLPDDDWNGIISLIHQHLQEQPDLASRCAERVRQTVDSNEVSYTICRQELEADFPGLTIDIVYLWQTLEKTLPETFWTTEHSRPLDTSNHLDIDPVQQRLSGTQALSKCQDSRWHGRGEYKCQNPHQGLHVEHESLTEREPICLDVGSSQGDNTRSIAQTIDNLDTHGPTKTKLDDTSLGYLYIVYGKDMGNIDNTTMQFMLKLLPLAGKCMNNIVNSEKCGCESVWKEIIHIGEALKIIGQGVKGNVIDPVMHLIEDIIGPYGIYQKPVLYGSTPLGLQIGMLNEVDFALPITSQCPIKLFQGPTFEVTEEPQSAHLANSMDTLFTSVSSAVQGLEKPDNPHLGGVFLDSVYKYTRAPSLCIKLAWYCDKDHRHVMDIDLTPSLKPSMTLGDLWKPPYYFNVGLFKVICNELKVTPPTLVLDTASTLLSSSGISRWKLTFNHCDKIVYNRLDRISPNIKNAMRCLKYIRDVTFPRVMKYSRPDSDGVTRSRDGALVSSYPLQQLLYFEVLEHSNPADWEGVSLYHRVTSILRGLLREEYRSFYTDTPASVLSITPADRPRIYKLLHRDVTYILDNLSSMCDNYHVPTSSCIGQMEKIIDTKVLEGAVYVVLPSGGLKTYKRSDILYEDSVKVRMEIGIGEYDNIYYYQFSEVGRSLLSMSLVCGLFEYCLTRAGQI